MPTLHPPVGASDHISGDLNAPIVLVEYGDYQCPACGAAYPLVKQIQKQFGKEVCLVFRNYPLVNAHPQAQPAAVVAEFAAQHGKFWEAHDALYENQRGLGEHFYVQLVQSLGLSTAELQKAVQADAFEPKIRGDIDSGDRSGVNGTPTFFINGERFDSPRGFGDLGPVIEELLRPTR